MMTSTRPTPPQSPGSANKRQRIGLSLDLSDLPPLVTPAPPSNTLLVTNLHDPEIFIQQTLTQIRQLIDDHTDNAIYTFSPLRSMRRIIITFHTVEAAIKIRSLLDGETLFQSRLRIYFGEPTPIEQDAAASAERRLLKAPKADKLFFISPPPSPPLGWESKEEDPPNKDVHAEDLAEALERLNAKGLSSATTQPSTTNASSSQEAQRSASDDETRATWSAKLTSRKRSSSILLYDPQESGHSPDLPAIAVEDTTGEPDTLASDGLNAERSTPVIPRTEMPPTDLKFDGAAQ